MDGQVVGEAQAKSLLSFGITIDLFRLTDGFERLRRIFDYGTARLDRSIILLFVSFMRFRYELPLLDFSLRSIID